MRTKITDYPRGSEWRIWDLHTHTPASFHWTDGATFLTLDEEGKNKAITKTITAINKSSASVFAITDYWTFEGYKKILSLKSTTPLTKKVFPGIELRVEAATDYRLNVQVILSDQLSTQQLNDFLSKLQIRFGKDKSRPLSEEALKEYAKGLDDGKAKKHGFEALDKLTDQEFILLGSQTAKVTIDSLEEALKMLPENSAFVVIPWELNDGLEKLDWEKHPHDDSCLITYANFIESRNMEAIDLFLHKETKKNKDIINDFKQYLKQRKIPVLCGSDTHKFSDYGKAYDSKYCWIKSDPSFEGLRQVLYEPGDRVKIQEDSPDEKKPYYVIDRIRYVDNTGKNWFSSSDIVLNPNLNAIIGGKSTGKSLLLYHIAKAIDPEEVDSRISNVKTLPNYDHFTQDPNFDFEVVWRDNISSSVKQNTSSRRILYIPQSYLSMLSETTTQSQKALNEFILNVITQNKEVKDSKEKEEQVITKTSNKIIDLINNFFALEQQAKLKKEVIEKTGDEQGIKKYIRGLNQKIEMIKKQSGLSPVDMKTIKLLFTDKEKADGDILELQQDQNVIDTLYTSIATKLQEIESLKNEKVAYIVNKNLVESVQKRIEWIDTLPQRLAKDTETTKKELDKQEKILNSKIKEINTKLKPLLDKVKLQKKLNELITDLKEEERKLKKIQLLKINLKADAKQLGDIKTRILEKYGEVFKGYQDLQSGLKKGESQLEDISLNIGINFKEEKFNQECVELYLNKFDLKRILGIKGDEEFCYKYGKNHLSNIATIFEKTLNGEIGTIKNRTRKEAVVKLLEDYYMIRFSVTYKNDSLDRMSPGKRALVLLKLLIFLSQEEYPILIDQPESDLDNRSVYVDLVKFIKEKKKERQIITVTHNPNLVVAADSEEVIVANQRGQDPTKENRQYQFEYVSGSLENSLSKDVSEQAVLYQKGIREHVCEILEGGEEAFKKREMKYNLPDTLTSTT